MRVSKASATEYERQATEYQRRRNRRGIIETTIMLMATYGLLIYFILATITQAVARK